MNGFAGTNLAGRILVRESAIALVASPLRAICHNPGFHFAVHKRTGHARCQAPKYLESWSSGHPAMFGINVTPGISLAVSAWIALQFGGNCAAFPGEFLTGSNPRQRLLRKDL